MKTISVVKVPAKAGMATSAVPSRAASRGDLPIRMCRMMLSTTTMPTSTVVPTASDKPPKVMTLIVWPLK